jgi:hypothetical protein
MERKQEIAQTIYQQLGGNKFKVMTGATAMYLEEDGMYGLAVTYKMCRKSNVIKILLNGKDLYNVEFCKLKKFQKGRAVYNEKSVAKFEDVYCDQLAELFESQTGLYTSL